MKGSNKKNGVQKKKNKKKCRNFKFLKGNAKFGRNYEALPLFDKKKIKIFRF